MEKLIVPGTSIYFMEDNPEYFFEIVYLRAIAILAVISIHVSASFTKMQSISFLTLVYMSTDTFSHFAVPLFVTISGFVLFNKYQGSFPVTSFYKKRLLSVVPQYTIFSIIGIFFIYFTNLYTGIPWNFSTIGLIYQYLTGTAFYTLWFFVLIIQFYLLYPVIGNIYARSVRNHTIGAFLVFLLIIQIIYQAFSVRNMFLVGPATLFFGYLFYFVAGIYVRSHYAQYKEWVLTLSHPNILFFGLLPATILGIGSYSLQYFTTSLTPQVILLYTWIFSICTPFYYGGIFVLCLYCGLKISAMNPDNITRFFQRIGNNSFGIFLVHGFFLSIFTLVSPKMGFDWNNWLFYPVAFTLVLSLSIALVFLLNKVPGHEYIIGRAR
jgi:probable poly-beta-1,6-N-acetyl-D-glucosamine export protein